MPELNRRSEKSVDSFCRQVKALGEQAMIEGRKHVMTTKFKNLEEITPWGYIGTTLNKQHNSSDIAKTVMKRINKVYGSAQMLLLARNKSITAGKAVGYGGSCTDPRSRYL